VESLDELFTDAISMQDLKEMVMGYTVKGVLEIESKYTKGWS